MSVVKYKTNNMNKNCLCVFILLLLNSPQLFSQCLTCPGNFTVTANIMNFQTGVYESVNIGDQRPTVKDSCLGFRNISVYQKDGPVSTFLPVGNTTLVWEMKYECGNFLVSKTCSTQCSFEVTVLPSPYAERALWYIKPGNAIDIAANLKGDIWAVNLTGVMRWNGSSWTNIPAPSVGIRSRIAVDAVGKPWLVTNNLDIFHYNGTTWDSIRGKATDITVDANLVWVTRPDGSIWKWNGNTWKSITGTAIKIAADGSGNLWTVNGVGDVMMYTNGAWTRLAEGRAKDIGVTGGNVWMTAQDGFCYRWTGSYWRSAGPMQNAYSIAVTSTGYPWMIDNQNRIFLMEL